VRLLSWFHPLAAAVTLALALRGAALGLGGRGVGTRAARDRAAHAALMPWVYGLMFANWVGGLGSVAWLRDDLDLATSGHFLLGSAIMALMTAAALLSRRVAVDARARLIHPWIGAAALLCCGVQVFLGLQLLAR
jgi:hypothetical protein